MLTLTFSFVYLFSGTHGVRGHSIFCISQDQEGAVCPFTQS